MAESSGAAAPDPRITLAQGFVYHGLPEEAVKLLDKLDTADRAAGVIRVRTDDATVERMVLAQLGAEPGMDGYAPAKVWAVLSNGERRKRLECARAVLEALATPTTRRLT